MIMVIMTMIMVIISMLQIKIMKNKMLQITFNPPHWMMKAGQPSSSPSPSALQLVKLVSSSDCYWDLELFGSSSKGVC